MCGPQHTKNVKKCKKYEKIKNSLIKNCQKSIVRIFLISNSFSPYFFTYFEWVQNYFRHFFEKLSKNDENYCFSFVFNAFGAYLLL